MHDITTGKHTVIKDSSGRIVLVIANTLPDVNIGESIPTGTLGWDKDSGTINRYVDGAWSAELGTLDIDGTLTVGGGAEFLEDTHFVSGLHVHGSENEGGIRWFAGQGDQTTEAHRHEGTITVDLDLAGVDHKDSAATLIPARAWIHAVGLQVLTGFTGGSVNKLDVGLTGGDASGLINDVTLIALGQFSTAAVAIGLTSNSDKAGVTVTALTAIDGAAVCTTGKVRLTIWYSSVDGPDGVTYA